MDNYKEQFLQSDDSDIPADVLQLAASGREKLLPVKSGDKYEVCYEKFLLWRERKKVSSFNETVLMAYMTELSQTKSPTTLKSTFSMLKKMMQIKHKIKLDGYTEVYAFLKRFSVGYKPKKAKILTADEVKRFLDEAPEEEYLLTKTILVMGVMGACRKCELHSLRYEDVLDDEARSELTCILRDCKNNEDRRFTVDQEFYPLVKRYMALRSKRVTYKSFFIRYNGGVNPTCSNLPVGEHTFGDMPHRIAEFLGLDSPDDYTGHSFRHTSATILADSGASMTVIQKAGGWKSPFSAQGYIANSRRGRQVVSSHIRSALGFTSALVSETPQLAPTPKIREKPRSNDSTQPKKARIETVTSKTANNMDENKENEDVGNDSGFFGGSSNREPIVLNNLTTTNPTNSNDNSSERINFNSATSMNSTTSNDNSRNQRLHLNNETSMNATNFNGVTIYNYGTINFYQREP